MRRRKIMESVLASGTGIQSSNPIIPSYQSSILSSLKIINSLLLQDGANIIMSATSTILNLGSLTLSTLTASASIFANYLQSNLVETASLLCTGDGEFDSLTVSSNSTFSNCTGNSFSLKQTQTSATDLVCITKGYADSRYVQISTPAYYVSSMSENNTTSVSAGYVTTNLFSISPSSPGLYYVTIDMNYYLPAYGSGPPRIYLKGEYTGTNYQTYGFTNDLYSATATPTWMTLSLTTIVNCPIKTPPTINYKVNVFIQSGTAFTFTWRAGYAMSRIGNAITP